MVLWHAVRGEKWVEVIVREGNIIKVRDENGIYWLANKGDIEWVKNEKTTKQK